MLSGYGHGVEALDGFLQLPSSQTQLPGLPLTSVPQSLGQLPLGLSGLQVRLGWDLIPGSRGPLLWVTYKERKGVTGGIPFNYILSWRLPQARGTGKELLPVVSRFKY